MTGLSSITISNVNLQYAFSYNNSGEMLQATLPYKGYLKWSYGAASYSSGFTQREVQSRTLSKDGTAGSEKVYSFSHESNTNANPVHSYTILDDPGGVGEKYWAFNVSGSYIGLLSQYQGRDRSYTPTRTLTQNDITWAGSENPYLSSNLTTADPGQSYSVQSKTTQTLDSYGNVTQVAKYNFGNLSTAYRTYNYTYLNSSAYTSRYIYNRLTSATVTDGTNTSTLQSIIYDGGSLAAASGEHEWDTNYGSVTARGNPTSITDTSGTRTMSYNELGNAVSVTPNGVTRSISTSTTTNFAATEQLTVGSLTTTNTYSSFLGLTNETGPNSASISMGYDLIARPNSVTGVFGAATTNTYNDTASPPTFVSTINGRWTRQTLDGFGRTILTETGDANGTKSQAETVFDSCGCSPFGKMTKQAFAHAPNTSPAYTTYAYDGIGRTLTVAAGGSDTTGTTTYLYQGNTIKLTDAAGKWKKFTMDALGNLLQVNEPNPGGGNDYVSTYAYDVLGHLITVSMTRSTGTQTRTFNYGTSPGILLLSATNPENGTVTNTYNSYNKIAARVDAKGPKGRLHLRFAGAADKSATLSERHNRRCVPAGKLLLRFQPVRRHLFSKHRRPSRRGAILRRREPLHHDLH
jgi:YD repeat-containing protein